MSSACWMLHKGQGKSVSSPSLESNSQTSSGQRGMKHWPILTFSAYPTALLVVKFDICVGKSITAGQQEVPRREEKLDRF